MRVSPNNLAKHCIVFSGREPSALPRKSKKLSLWKGSQSKRKPKRSGSLTPRKAGEPPRPRFGLMRDIIAWPDTPWVTPRQIRDSWILPQKYDFKKDRKNEGCSSPGNGRLIQEIYALIHGVLGGWQHCLALTAGHSVTRTLRSVTNVCARLSLITTSVMTREVTLDSGFPNFFASQASLFCPRVAETAGKYELGFSVNNWRTFKYIG